MLGAVSIVGVMWVGNGADILSLWVMVVYAILAAGWIVSAKAM